MKDGSLISICIARRGSIQPAPDGVEVSRSWQMARDRHGKVWLWLGQRKRTARGVKEPGVTFDRIARR